MIRRGPAEDAPPQEPESEPIGPSSPAQPLSPERLNRVRAAHRNYYRWLRLSRLTLGAFMLMGAVVLLWLVPWLPSGLDTNDYTPEMAFTVYLLGGAAVLGLLALGFQERARRDRESLLVWAMVYDEVTGLHNRTYLYDRLAMECERAKRSGQVFSVIVLQIRLGGARAKSGRRRPELSNAALRKLAQLLDGLTHPTDMVALLSGSELAVLAIRVDRDARHQLQQRLRQALAEELPELLDRRALLDVKAGSATYGVDGMEPGPLVQTARTAATLGVRPRAKAA